MDALLPPLNPFMVELPAPPELNENSTGDLRVDEGNSTESTSIQDALMSPAPEDEPKDAAALENEIVEPVQGPENDEPNLTNVGTICADRLETGSVKSEPEDESPQLEDVDTLVALKVEECVNSVVDKVVKELDGDDPNANCHSNDVNTCQASHESSEEVEDTDLKATIRDCYVFLDNRVVSKYLLAMKKRKDRRAARRASQQGREKSQTEGKRRALRDPPPPLPNLPIMTRVSCKECHDSFLEARVLRFHFRAKHVDILDDVISECGRIKQFIICPLCKDTTFRAKVDFHSHMQAYHSISRWVFEGMDCYDHQLLGDVIAEQLRKKIEKGEVSKLKIEKLEMAKPTKSSKSKEIATLPEDAPACKICHRQFATERGVVNHMTIVHPNEYVGPWSSKASTTASSDQQTSNQQKKPMAGPKSARFRQKAPMQKKPIAETVVPVANTSTAVAKVATSVRRAPTSILKSTLSATAKPPTPVLKSLVCEWCRDRLKTTAQLHTHLRSKHSVPKNLNAEGCNLPDFFTAMEHHFTVDEKEENSYECVSCKETFLEKVGLLEHFSGEHLKSKVVGMEIKLQCGICGHNDSDVRNLHDHMWNDHANQKLEDLVIRVRDVRSSHRCGEECQLLWKKPVVSVEAAPRASKRPSSEVIAMPRSSKARRDEKAIDMQVSEDDEKIMRIMEELEEQKLREQELNEKKDALANKKKQELEERRERKREANVRYKAKKRAIQSQALQDADEDSFVEVGTEPTDFLKMSEPIENNAGPRKRAIRCLLCLVPCEDIQKHIAEVHTTSMESLKRNIRARIKTASPEKQPETSPQQKSSTPKPPGPASRTSSSVKSSPLVVRCPTCKVHFPDIMTMMRHQVHCSVTFAGSSKLPPSTTVTKHPQPKKSVSPPTQSASVSAPNAGKPAQFVLMDEEEPPQEKFRCFSCKITYDSVGAYQAHVQEYHLDEICCELCPSSFKDEASLNKHVCRSHGVTYPCIPCGAQFTAKKKFLQHVANEHQIMKSNFDKISLINIEKVEEIFANLGYVKGGKYTSAGQSTPPAPHAGQNSSAPNRLPSRTRSRPKPVVQQIKQENVDLPVLYQCELCEACYPTQLEIAEHMQYVH